MSLIEITLLTLVCLFTLALTSFAWISHREGERRAARLALGLACAGAVLVALILIAPTWMQSVLLAAILGLVLVAAILFFLPIGRVKVTPDTPTARFDERQVLFARARLQPGSPQYQAYYALHPEHLDSDEKTRARPGLLSPQSKYANPFHFASPVASFELISALREAVGGTPASEKKRLPVDQLTKYIKALAVYYGALEVGIAELKPYHVYSHIGRGAGVWGDPIPVELAHAIAFTVEMDFSMVSSAPRSTVVMESARQYVEAARVAVQLAGAIRQLGYTARAHIDGNYRVIAPLVARDASLGEIGRMGLLMTPRQGPRVRLGVVTTDMPLQVDPHLPDAAVIDFCTICKKCAENCPSQSIPFGDRQEIDGALRWKLDAESCFLYWNTIGTDCGRCLSICPYSHPDSPAHNLARWGSARSGAFRRFALKMDDFFYGRRPQPKAAPQWTRVP